MGILNLVCFNGCLYLCFKDRGIKGFKQSETIYFDLSFLLVLGLLTKEYSGLFFFTHIADATF